MQIVAAAKEEIAVFHGIRNAVMYHGVRAFIHDENFDISMEMRREKIKAVAHDDEIFVVVAIFFVKRFHFRILWLFMIRKLYHKMRINTTVFEKIFFRGYDIMVS